MKTNSGSPRDAIPMAYCTNAFQGQAGTRRLQEGTVQMSITGEMRRLSGACLLACPLLLVVVLKDTEVAFEYACFLPVGGKKKKKTTLFFGGDVVMRGRFNLVTKYQMWIFECLD